MESEMGRNFSKPKKEQTEVQKPQIIPLEGHLKTPPMNPEFSDAPSAPEFKHFKKEKKKSFSALKNREKGLKIYRSMNSEDKKSLKELMEIDIDIIKKRNKYKTSEKEFKENVLEFCSNALKGKGYLQYSNKKLLSIFYDQIINKTKAISF